jgi:hypothetical protein
VLKTEDAEKREEVAEASIKKEILAPDIEKLLDA